jgi:TonB family protein
MPAMIVLFLIAFAAPAVPAAAAEEPQQKSPAAALEVAAAGKLPPIAVKVLNAEKDALPDRPLALIKLIKPIYPEAGRAESLSGSVQLDVAVDEEGAVDSVKTVSGHPVLAEAATAAIRRWTYQAAVVNGKAVRTNTLVKLNFKAPE